MIVDEAGSEILTEMVSPAGGQLSQNQSQMMVHCGSGSQPETQED